MLVSLLLDPVEDQLLELRAVEVGAGELVRAAGRSSGVRARRDRLVAVEVVLAVVELRG